MATASTQCDPDERSDLKALIAEVVADSATWMNTPNDQLGGAKPKDLIGTNQEERLRELARAIKIGMPT